MSVRIRSPLLGQRVKSKEQGHKYTSRRLVVAGLAYLEDYRKMKDADNRQGWGRPWGLLHRHYFRNGKSLCGGISFFDGDLSANGGDRDGQDCPECRELLSKKSSFSMCPGMT